jgi:hypothetical protein
LKKLIFLKNIEKKLLYIAAFPAAIETPLTLFANMLKLSANPIKKTHIPTEKTLKVELGRILFVVSFRHPEQNEGSRRRVRRKSARILRRASPPLG